MGCLKEMGFSVGLMVGLVILVVHGGIVIHPNKKLGTGGNGGQGDTCDIVDNREASSMFVPRNDGEDEDDDDDDDEESESSEGDESGDFGRVLCHSEVVEMKKPGQPTKGHRIMIWNLRIVVWNDPAEYMLAICGNDALRELSSPGKSGSNFYLTQDDRFIIKTLKKSEVKVSDCEQLFSNTLMLEKIGLFLLIFHFPQTSDIDCQFLEAENIMDYSLLIGVHICSDSNNSEMNFSPSESPDEDRSWRKGMPFMLFLFGSPKVNPPVSSAANVPARAMCISRSGSESTSGQGGCEANNAILCLGIIDILQDYDISKRLEHAYKSLRVDLLRYPAVDPSSTLKDSVIL
ncbi:hypothetical protein HAX54_032280 [Datura stramonium]|uniref:1-phosphatidylinositol-4-phosphate 5-kinase n=1 Tax=Datura stramonium TaxID=4076 RepID=A0ABS8RLJ2_DATST|nr:hypothetical protein [Datura stramonium]